MYCEIVRVIDGYNLRDPQACKHRYRTPDGNKLVPGIYAACWPGRIEAPCYDTYAMYVGPFPTWTQAGEYARLLSEPQRRSSMSGARAGKEFQIGVEQRQLGSSRP